MRDMMHSRILACPTMPEQRDLTSAVQAWCGTPTVVPAAFAADAASKTAAPKEAESRIFIARPFPWVVSLGAPLGLLGGLCRAITPGENLRFRFQGAERLSFQKASRRDAELRVFLRPRIEAVSRCSWEVRSGLE